CRRTRKIWRPLNIKSAKAARRFAVRLRTSSINHEIVVTSSPRTARSAKKRKTPSPRTGISSSSPLGMLALHLLAQWRKGGRDGIVFLAENENRAERLGAVTHALDPACDVLVYPRLNTLPFDQLEPSRDIAGRRSTVLRRLAKPKKPILLITTAEAMME